MNKSKAKNQFASNAQTAALDASFSQKNWDRIVQEINLIIDTKTCYFETLIQSLISSVNELSNKYEKLNERVSTIENECNETIKQNSSANLNRSSEHFFNKNLKENMMKRYSGVSDNDETNDSESVSNR